MEIKKNQKQRKKREVPIYIYIVTILFSLLFIYFGNQYTSTGLKLVSDKGYKSVEKSKIIKIIDIQESAIDTSGTHTLEVKDILFEAEILSGERKGETIQASQNLNNYMTISPREVSLGDKVIVYEIPEASLETGSMWVFGDYVRTDALLVLGAIFFAMILLFGGFKGLQTIISLSFTVLAIFMVFVPAILTGRNIYFWAILICLYVTVMSLVLVGGVNKKTVAAIAGCMGGLLVSGLIIIIMDVFLKLTGMVNDESVYLIMLNPENPMNLKAMFFGAILIGAMGAIMDVAMSIASSLNELHEKAPHEPWFKLVQSGFRIGKDIMGTMANTLILAYIGSSLSIVLLMYANNFNLLDLFNREMVVIEVLQAIAGSLGILFSIPITTLISSFLYKRGTLTHEAEETVL